MCKPQGSALAGDISVTSPPPPSESPWLKRWLERCKHVGSHVNKQCLLVVALVLVALLVMVLLLLWNYQCIMVTRMCQEDGSEYAYFKTDLMGPSFT